MAGNSRCIVLSVPDMGMLKRAEILLEWESHRRGTTVGWALYQLVVAAADVERYSRKLRSRMRVLLDRADRQYEATAARCSRGRMRPTCETLVTDRELAYRVNLATSECYQVVSAILMYEAVLRGLTKSQAACSLIASAAKAWSYPEEVRALLDKVDREVALRAIERSSNELRVQGLEMPGNAYAVRRQGGA